MQAGGMVLLATWKHVMGIRIIVVVTNVLGGRAGKGGFFPPFPHAIYGSPRNTIVLEFNQYSPGSRWRRTSVRRKDHREEGNETDGFYGGIQKVESSEVISTWKRLWPAEVLE
nr:F-box protein At2g32560 isoform X2 [Ipomoea batatas]